MKKPSIQFWMKSGIALCCVVTTSPSYAQDISIYAPHGITIQGNINFWKANTANNVDKLLKPLCSASRKQANSQFIITGRGGLPPSPVEVLRSEQPLVDLGTPIQGEAKRISVAIPATPARKSVPPTQIMEAQGWVRSTNGEVVLTTRPSTATSNSPWLIAANCYPPNTAS